MGRVWKRGVKVAAIAAAVVAIPTAAFAAIGTFTNNTAAPAVTGTNSSAAAGAAGVAGTNTGGGFNTRYGVTGNANGPAGVGVQGTGTKFGVFSNGPLGVAVGKPLTCTGCVGAGALSTGSVTSTKLAAGSVGPTALSAASLPTTYELAGLINPVTLGGTKFIGPLVNVAVGAGQAVVGNEVANLGSSGGAVMNPDLCYDSGGGPQTINSYFLDNVGLNAGVRREVPVSRVFKGLAPGSYWVGLCSVGGVGTLDLNDYAQGSVTVEFSN